MFQDYQSAAKKEMKDNQGNEFVKFTAVKVIRTSIEGNIAEVIVQVTGDWTGSADPGFFAGPCGGFTKSKGNNQSVEKKMIYKKYDTGWQLQRIL